LAATQRKESPLPRRRVNPPPLRWLIGQELARHRDEAGLSMMGVSKLVGITKPKLGQLETGRQFQSATDIALLLNAYGTDRETIDRLVALTERAEEAAWATGSAHAVPDWFRIYLGLERIATRVFTFDPLLVPGLLQEQRYAHAVTSASLFVRRPDVDRVVELRMARRQRLYDTANQLELHAVTTEAALRMRMPDSDVHKAQLQHLLDLSERPNVTIQVLTPDVGYHDAHRGQFGLLDFEEVRSLAYTETIDSALYVQDPDQVKSYALVAKALEEQALDPEETSKLIAEVIANLNDS
jgi:transcriptional regulator with XRE-family HTH domain